MDVPQQKTCPRLYTNDSFEGGETTFFEPDPSLPVSNKKLTPQQLGKSRELVLMWSSSNPHFHGLYRVNDLNVAMIFRLSTPWLSRLRPIA